MRRKKSWGKTHFLSPVWIREKIREKKFNELFFTSLKKIGKLIDYKH